MKRFLLLVGALFLLASCTSELDQMINGSRTDVRGSKAVFQASTEGPASPETKVYADENLKVLWNADDRISIFNKTTFNYQFAFTGDDGDTAGSFENIPTSDFITGAEIDNIYAVYPYDKKNKLSNSCVLTVTLPSEQAYKEKSFGIGANTMVVASENNFLAFKNVGGYLNLRLYGDNVSVSRITIKGNNGEKIAGKASIEMPLGGVPTATMDATATDEISIVCDPAVKIGEDENNYTDFWFVIPPVTFEQGFKITVTDEMGGVFEKSTTKSFTVTRNQLDWMSALKVVPNYDNVIIQFEDANFKAYCVENFDTDGDGEVSKAEAEKVLNIRVSPENIASLGGIEYFKNLTSLDCSVQANKVSYSMKDGVWVWHRYRKDVEVIGLLTSLDLSSNTSLKTLICYGNQLASIDISNNSKLESLSCDCNLLTSLDISNNTELNSLGCGGNRLSSIDLSNNDNLTSLHCNFNLLTAIDINTKTDLTSLNCNYNQLTSLDVSHNTALTSLYCESNQLTSLDVSHNTALTSLYCESNQLTGLDVSHNTALTHLNCKFNQLTSLDVSNNTALQYLYCYSNQLTSLDITSCTALMCLNCQYNQLMSLDVSNNSALADFDCRSNQSGINIYIRGGQLFSSFLHDDSAIITEKGTPIPTGNITFNDSAFKEYCVASFDKDGDGEVSYAEALIVSIISCYNQGIQSLSGIEYFTNLNSLSCYSNQLTSLDVSNNTALQYLLCDSNQLTSLDVSHNTALLDLWCQSNQLTSLDVSNNPALTQLLCDSNQLTSLDISKNTKLSTLWCDSNQLTSLDVSKNTALQTLGCESNQLTSLDVSKNTALKSLSCSSNQLTSLDVSNNTALTTLRCYSNPSLLEIWLKMGQTIQKFSYDTDVATIKYKD